MTVIAYDGRYVAADRMATCGPTKQTTRKLHVQGKRVITFDGNLGHGIAQVAWLSAGGDPEKWPKPQDCAAYMHVFERGMPVVIYEGPYPAPITDPIYAAGSGKGIAYGAMEMGATAEQAVAVASKWGDGCGNGVDVIDLWELKSEPDAG